MNLFFQLIQVALGQRRQLDTQPTAQQWNGLLETARQQALLGVCYTALESLPVQQRPPEMVLLQWYGLTTNIEERNRQLNSQAFALQEWLHSYGFRSCILKGQGMAAYYPNPLRRQCGDIDIWVEGGRKRLVRFCRERVPHTEVVYHHLDFPVLRGTSVEVHFRPSFMYSPWTNHRLTQWLRSQAEACFHTSGASPTTFTSPSTSFNLVYILLHIYRHLLAEGVGLRQLLDYYYVVLARDRNDDAATLATYRRLGLMCVAGAAMYVLREVFGMERSDMIVPPRESDGRYMLREIITAGNFGHFDPRNQAPDDERLWHRFIRRQRLKLRFLFSYPSEVLCSPLFSVVQYIWRRFNGYL